MIFSLPFLPRTSRAKLEEALGIRVQTTRSSGSAQGGKAAAASSPIDGRGPDLGNLEMKIKTMVPGGAGDDKDFEERRRVARKKELVCRPAPPTVLFKNQCGEASIYSPSLTLISLLYFGGEKVFVL